METSGSCSSGSAPDERALRALTVGAPLASAPLATGRFHRFPDDEDGASWEWFDRDISCETGCVDAVVITQAHYDALLGAVAALRDAATYIEATVLNTSSRKTEANYAGCLRRVEAAIAKATGEAA